MNITNKGKTHYRYLIVDKNLRCHYSTATKDQNYVIKMDSLLPNLSPFVMFDSKNKVFINF